MTSLRQIFASGVLGLALALGAGCASQSAPDKYTEERPKVIPPDAALASTGTATLMFTPTTHGRVYIYDRTADKLLYEGEVDRNNLVEVDAPKNRILVGGKVVSERDLKPGHDKLIYFRPQSTTVVEERTVVYYIAHAPAPAVARPRTVPTDAALTTSGNANLSFKPTMDGRVYIYDRTADKLLYQGAVERGEVVEVDAPGNRIQVGGQTVTERDLKPGHDMEIYFRSEPSGSR